MRFTRVRESPGAAIPQNPLSRLVDDYHVLSHRFGIPMSEGSGPDNRRRHGRIRCAPAVCELGEIVNISASGMLVRTRSVLKDDSEVAFWIDGPDGQFTVTARVIRCPKIGWFKHEAALQFLGLSDDARNALVAMARLAATHQEIL